MFVDIYSEEVKKCREYLFKERKSQVGARLIYRDRGVGDKGGERGEKGGEAPPKASVSEPGPEGAGPIYNTYTCAIDITNN